MNTHDIELPPLPKASKMYDIPGYDEEELKDYARAAIEADRKHFAELFTDLSRYANGMYEQEYDPYMEGVADGYGYAAEFLLGNRNAAEEIEADRKRGGEVVVWLYEDELPDNYPYEAMFPYSKVDGVRMFPVYAPQPAEPVKVPSDEEIRELSHEFSGMTYEDLDVVGFGRALLDRYGKGAP